MKKSQPNKLGFRIVGLGALALAAFAPWASLAADGKQEPPKQGRSSNDPPTMSKGKLGQDLFFAIGRRNVAEVEALLKKGADPNSRNGLEFTPLYVAAASHQPDIMKALMGAKADIEAESPYGTPMMFAAISGHTEGIKILRERGADVNVARVDGTTVLMMAAQSGNPTAVAELLKYKPDVNQASYSGATSLSYAARGGYASIGKMLLAAKANPNTADDYGQTPLMIAAQAGNADFVKLLLESGAKPNAKDKKGRTALMLAASYGDYPEVVSALMSAGADASLKDKKGRTAATLAAKHGYEKSAGELGYRPNGGMPSRSTEAALKSGLKLLEVSMNAFSESATCFSCHQEGLGRMVTGSAKSKGFATDAKLNGEQLERIRGFFGEVKPLLQGALSNPELMKQVPLIEINEVTPGVSWLFAGMVSNNDSANEATAAAAMVLARQQSPDGSWTFSLPRVPMQSSFATFTALSVRALQRYGPKAQSEEIQGRIAKAKEWLQGATGKTIDDMAFRLMGLKWSGATMEERQSAIEALKAAQLEDGGWAQMPNRSSDAYATGMAIYALRIAGGLEANDPIVEKGASYLIRTQDDDGSWFVNKRAIPANNYFDAKFPHGESQYASFNGTSWAVLGLLETLK